MAIQSSIVESSFVVNIIPHTWNKLVIVIQIIRSFLSDWWLKFSNDCYENLLELHSLLEICKPTIIISQVLNKMGKENVCNDNAGIKQKHYQYLKFNGKK